MKLRSSKLRQLAQTTHDADDDNHYADGTLGFSAIETYVFLALSIFLFPLVVIYRACLLAFNAASQVVRRPTQ